MPDVIPFLTYEDGIAALEWLAGVFGFTETARITSSDGRLSHGEMSVGDGLIMLASPSPDYEGPKRHRDNCEIAASWSTLPWVIDVFSSMLTTSTSTMLGPRPRERLSCLNRRMGRQHDDIELRTWKDIAGCSWQETSRLAIHHRNGAALCWSLAMRARFAARSFTPLRSIERKARK